MIKRLAPPLVLFLALLALLPAGATAGGNDAGLAQPQVEALLDLQHPRGLNHFLRTVSDPASPRYRHYATVEKLVARFGAPPKVRKKVLRWLAGHGLRGTLSPTGTFVTMPIPRHDAARLLPWAGGASASNAGPGGRRVPAALRGAVSRVALLGMGTTTAGHLTARAGAGAGAAASAAKKPSFPEPYRSILLHSGTASGCAAGSSGAVEPGVGLEPFTPNQFLSAYGQTAMHAEGLEGQGQTVAVVEAGGFRHSDIVTFDRCFGVETPPIRIVPVASAKPLPAEDETTLDLETLSVGAPKLDRIMVYEGPESLRGIVLTAATALGSPGHRPDVISISLGFCEQTIASSFAVREALDNVFAVAGGAGISVLVSAGDQGSTGCRATIPATKETTGLPEPAVSLPASSPYVTAVGGTNFGLSKKNRIEEEIVWNDSVLIPWGGGGGASILSPRTPWWQAGVHGYGPGRKVPDIAALADRFPGYAFFCTAASCGPGEDEVFGWGSVGGTSAASPLMASGVVLANQYAAEHGESDLGFLNPLLYRLGAGERSRASAFNDVVRGNNDIGRALPPEVWDGKPVGCCSAKAGYDWASGWGSLKIPGFARLAAAAAG